MEIIIRIFCFNNFLNLIFPYYADQWSPQHQDGKRVYSSDFLLQFRNIEHAMAKPTGLPSIDDIILNQVNIKHMYDVTIDSMALSVYMCYPY